MVKLKDKALNSGALESLINDHIQSDHSSKRAALNHRIEEQVHVNLQNCILGAKWADSEHACKIQAKGPEKPESVIL